MIGDPAPSPVAIIDRQSTDAVIFDMDGVVTQTASVHAAAWSALFAQYLATHAHRTGDSIPPFTELDYLRYVDGKPRSAGVRDFLASRNIVLPEGEPDDRPEQETVWGLGNRKNAFFLRALEEHGVQVYDSTITLIHRLKECGWRVGIISASRNTTTVLNAAGIRDLFEVQIDGLVAADLGLPGKPDPAVFLTAAQRLETPPARAVVIEDAIAGVQAGRGGGFGLVIGVDRGGNAEALAAAGAHAVVKDLAEVRLARAGSPCA